VFNDYTYTALNGRAAMSTPIPGTALAGASQAFTWTAGTGALGYQIRAGSIAGAFNYALVNTVTLGATVSGLPTDASPVYIRLYTQLPSGWVYIDYVYTAADGKAAVTSPTAGSALAGASQAFTWTAGTGALGYQIRAGSSPDAYNYALVNTGSTGATVSGLPTDASLVYIRLYTQLPSGWVFNDYTYTAADGKASMTSPTAGGTLAGASQAFTWTAGTGALGYQIRAGSSVGAYNYALVNTGSTGATVSGLPTNGSTVYIQLYTELPSGWVYRDYTYTAPPAP
jgi:hypothetical protein